MERDKEKFQFIKSKNQGHNRQLTIFELIKIVYRRRGRIIDNTLNLPKIEAPKGHKLFEYMQDFKYYDRALSRLMPIISRKYTDLKVIDIGANIGDNLAILRNDELSYPTLCIEGDDEYFQYLEKNTKKYRDVQIKKTFLGAEDERKMMQIVRDIAGTSHLTPSATGVEIVTLDTTLNEFEEFKLSKFLKIDTDGFDNMVLNGAREYLERAKPIIFMEYCPEGLARQNDNGLDIFRYLFSLGYRKALMYENFGEYMFSFNLNDQDFVEEMKDFFTKNKRIPYCDLCLFNESDLDLFKACRKSELDFFRNEKLSISPI